VLGRCGNRDDARAARQQLPCPRQALGSRLAASLPVSLPVPSP